MRGIENHYLVAANVPIASSVVPITVGLTSPIAVNQTQKITAWVPVSVGATGGVRVLVAVPAGGVLYNLSATVANTVADTAAYVAQAAAAAVTDALANAGTHWVEIDATIVNGATAGNIDVQVAQNTSDVLTLTVLRGGSLDATILN